MKRLFFDIETLPAEGKDIEIVKQLWEDAKKKSANSEKKTENTFDNFFRNTSFQGEFGRILCIGYAVEGEPVQCLFGDEKEILKDFWEIAKDADLFIGHNIMEFDLRFIYKRSIIHNIKPSRELNFARYRNNPIYDTMKEWEKWGAIGTSLHKLSLCLGVTSPKEAGIDGSKVYDFYLDGKAEEIYKYCKRDVEATRSVYERMTFMTK
jgi:DNA polymerase elongation subunit (family B)